MARLSRKSSTQRFTSSLWVPGPTTILRSGDVSGFARSSGISVNGVRPNCPSRNFNEFGTLSFLVNREECIPGGLENDPPLKFFAKPVVLDSSGRCEKVRRGSSFLSAEILRSRLILRCWKATNCIKASARSSSSLSGHSRKVFSGAFVTNNHCGNFVAAQTGVQSSNVGDTVAGDVGSGSYFFDLCIWGDVFNPASAKLAIQFVGPIGFVARSILAWIWDGHLDERVGRFQRGVQPTSPSSRKWSRR
jgi:hypothetical protein